MSLTQIFYSMFQLFLSVIIAVFVIFISYRIFIRANTDFDEEEEIKKGNIAVAILLAVILISSAMITRKGLYPIFNMLRVYFTVPIGQNLTSWQIPFFALAYFAAIFGLSVTAISFSLRLYGRLTTKINEGKELLKGNIAAGIVLSAVVIIVAMYVGDGIAVFARALIPQFFIGRMQVLP
ncbi:MAG: DUF350 domain-containing protein [Elusimicrobia bacterium]|nr:DUF350 domain-containing protein [Elusimicrobiota bacterium]